LNGAAAVASGAGTLPTVNIMNVGNNQAGAQQWFGTIARVGYYNSRLANGVLQQITS
jgi:hypothetical protein